MTIATLLLIAALILFVLAALPRLSVGINLVPAGLACATLALLVPLL